jgi:hypothetical protein
MQQVSTGWLFVNKQIRPDQTGHRRNDCMVFSALRHGHKIRTWHSKLTFFAPRILYRPSLHLPYPYLLRTDLSIRRGDLYHQGCDYAAR